MAATNDQQPDLSPSERERLEALADRIAEKLRETELLMGRLQAHLRIPYLPGDEADDVSS